MTPQSSSETGPAELAGTFRGAVRATLWPTRSLVSTERWFDELYVWTEGGSASTTQRARFQNEAMGDANRFQAVFTEYALAPEITRRRLYMETMTDVIPRMGRKVILDDSAKNVLPFLPLSAELSAPPAARPAATAPSTSSTPANKKR